MPITVYRCFADRMKTRKQNSAEVENRFNTKLSIFQEVLIRDFMATIKTSHLPRMKNFLFYVVRDKLLLLSSTTKFIKFHISCQGKKWKMSFAAFDSRHALKHLGNCIWFSSFDSSRPNLNWFTSKVSKLFDLAPRTWSFDWIWEGSLPN